MKTKTTKNAKTKQFAPGTKVRCTGAFLRNTGQYTGSDAHAVWKVLEQKGEFVTVDEVREDLSYWTAEELAANPMLKYRRVHANNLMEVGKPDYSNL